MIPGMNSGAGLFPQMGNATDMLRLDGGLEAVSGVAPIGFYHAQVRSSLGVVAGDKVTHWYSPGHTDPWTQTADAARLLYYPAGWDGRAQIGNPSTGVRFMTSSTLAASMGADYAITWAFNNTDTSSNKAVWSIKYSTSTVPMIAIGTPSSLRGYSSRPGGTATVNATVDRKLGRSVMALRYESATGLIQWAQRTRAGWVTLLSGNTTASVVTPNLFQMNKYGTDNNFEPVAYYRAVAIWGGAIPSLASLQAAGNHMVVNLDCPVE